MASCTTCGIEEKALEQTHSTGLSVIDACPDRFHGNDAERQERFNKALRREKAIDEADKLRTPRPLPAYTPQNPTLFAADDVDELVGGAFEKLKADFQERRAYMSESASAACEARLELLRHTWTILKDRAD